MPEYQVYQSRFAEALYRNARRLSVEGLPCKRAISATRATIAFGRVSLDGLTRTTIPSLVKPFSLPGAAWGL